MERAGTVLDRKTQLFRAGKNAVPTAEDANQLVKGGVVGGYNAGCVKLISDDLVDLAVDEVIGVSTGARHLMDAPGKLDQKS